MSNAPSRSRGFTIVELLIVIVVIGILAAITIVAFNGVRNKAIVASMQSDTDSGAKQIESFKITGSSYPAANDCSVTPAVNTICLKSSPGNIVSYTPTSGGASFCIQTDSSIDTTITPFHYSPKEGSVKSGPCPGGWDAIWAGDVTTCGVASGQLYCWGDNTYGQLGNGTTTDAATPQPIATPQFAASTITKMTMGLQHTCALAGGKAYCWGTNETGQLGIDVSQSATQRTPSPVIASAGQQLNGKTVTDLSASTQSTCAVANAKFYCWGKNANGDVGDGSGAQQYYPVAVSTTGPLSGKTAQILPGEGGQYGTCGIANGSPYCWGSNSSGVFGNGTENNQYLTPTATTTSGALSGKTVTAISVSQGGQSCAIASSAAYCWGTNGFLGNGTGSGSTTPVAVDTSGGDLRSNQTVQAIATLGSSSCLLADSQLYCWGTGIPWTKADGSGYNADAHYPWSPLKAIGPLANVKFTSLTGSYGHLCALSDSGFGYCWGSSYKGAIGNQFGSLVSYTYKFSAP